MKTPLALSAPLAQYLKPPCGWLLPACYLALIFGALGCGPSTGSRSDYQITFVIASADDEIDQLDFEVQYTGGGSFEGDRREVNCEGLNAAKDSEGNEFDDKDDDDTLEVHLEAGAIPMKEDDNVALCIFQSSVRPTAGNFKFNNVSADDEGSSNVAVTMEVEIDEPTSTTTVTVP